MTLSYVLLFLLHVCLLEKKIKSNRLALKEVFKPPVFLH